MGTASHPSVIIVDALELRRASIAALLEPWAATHGAAILAIAPDELNEGITSGLDPKFVIFSVGGTSLHAAHLSFWATEIRRLLPDVPCLVLSDRTEPEEAILAARLGEQAFMSTTVEPHVALQAFAFVIGGGTYFPREALLQNYSEPSPEARTSRGEGLTPRQLQVLDRLRLGNSNKVIARDLDMQESTVKVHVRQIMRKLGATNRTQAALFAARGGTAGTSGAEPQAGRAGPMREAFQD